MKDIEELKYKKDLVLSPEYQAIRQRQVDKIIALSVSNVEPLELKGMLKMIYKTDQWKDEFEKAIKEIKE